MNNVKSNSKIKGRLGFGCMRLPMNGEEIDLVHFSKMVDLFMERGFNYFDTAHGYISERSESAIHECLVKRYPRESYVLTDKLTGAYFNKREDIRPFFEKQLEILGVEYLDYYLMHSQSKKSYEKFKACGAYEEALKLKAEGKIRHIGISFHDTAETLEQILRENPEIEIVQIQLNYVDYESPAIQSRLCYETCVKYGKDVLVMEPVKGGSLVKLPKEAEDVILALGTSSPAGMAIRFVAGLENVSVVLSGMSTIEMMDENTALLQDFKPLSEQEAAALREVKRILSEKQLISCTSCKYCVDGCPRGIKIPDIFACYNGGKLWGDWTGKFYYEVHTKDSSSASDCIRCGRCESACPQNLPIISLLATIAEEFEAKQ